MLNKDINDLSISLIVPAFNEEKTIAKVVATAIKSNLFSEIICVNDGSTDKTLVELVSFGKKVKVINFNTNKGKGAALAEGVRAANTDLVMFIDADLPGIKPYHFKKLYSTFISKKLDALLGTVDLFPNVFIALFSIIRLSPYKKGNDELTGQRVYFRKDLTPHLKTIEKLGYGVEVYFNHVFRDKKVGFTRLKGLKHLMKHDKRGWNYKMLQETMNQNKVVAKEIAYQKIPPRIRELKKILSDNNITLN
jgi:glycosyltransferase involved in cell wall biosynthesis